MELSYVCSQLITMIHCNIIQINAAGEIEKYYGDMAELYNPLFTDSEFLIEICNRKRQYFPDIFCEKENIIYAVISGDTEKLIVGPVSIDKETRQLNHYMIQKHKIKDNIGFSLGWCEKEIFGTAVLILYHLMTGREMDLNELWEKNGIQIEDISKAKNKVTEVIFERLESAQPHNPYDQEVRAMDSIRKGDTEMLRKTLSETYCGQTGRLAKNPVRQAKNLAICVITLASRAAISGGMIPEEAYSMVDGYVLKIEEMNDAIKIEGMMRQAEYDFTDRVAEIHQKRQKNELIERTKNYIFQNLHSEINISAIGRVIGVNNSYLSDLFHKVEGITIQKYIRREKIRLAENMLRYSEYEIKSIANYLSFCSQSYFGSVFKEVTGMSPAKYRKKFGQWKETK